MKLLDTVVFDDNSYFDIFVEYSKAGPEDICIRMKYVNRGPKTAAYHVLPHFCLESVGLGYVSKRDRS